MGPINEADAAEETKLALYGLLDGGSGRAIRPGNVFAKMTSYSDEGAVCILGNAAN